MIIQIYLLSFPQKALPHRILMQRKISTFLPPSALLGGYKSAGLKETSAIYWCFARSNPDANTFG